MKKYFNFIKIEHTLFSLPLIYSGMALGYRANLQAGVTEATAGSLVATGLLILGAATGARTVGFAMNRIVDRQIDAKNPRTANRELPAGKMQLKHAFAVMAFGFALYMACAAGLNQLCLLLSPVPLVVFAVYPYLKRFTALAHFGVGSSLCLGPLGAYFAMRPTLDGALPAIMLSVFTWFWASGFDIIYSTSDEEFDKREGLFSLPSRYGIKRALQVSGVTHIISFALLVGFYLAAFAGSVLAGVLLLLAGVLLYLEQKKAEDVELAFFKINALIGFVILVMVLIGVNLT